MTATYDDATTIHNYLNDLEGLHRLIQVRKEAYNRGERLHEFCILGRFFLDGCGNCGRMSDNIPAELYQSNPYSETPDQVQKVMTHKELQLFMRGQIISWGGDSGIPPYDAVCPVCSKGWTIDNCYDTEAQRNENGTGWDFYHDACIRRKGAAGQRKLMVYAFTEAGYPNVNLITIPNEYYGGNNGRKVPYYACPWYLAQVDDGPVFKIGWRKSVISIDWSDTKICLSDLFKDQNTTKDDFLVHAPGYEKAAEYLSKLIPALEEK